MLFRHIMDACKKYSTPSVSKVIKGAAASPPEYDACIDLLNDLQSNAQYIKNQTKPAAQHSCSQIAQVQNYLTRSGLSLEKLDQLSVIHVAGTKGKGTTCALTEHILRAHGFKTGFYSSPHLVEVRERIRINGKPISKQDFAYYFWKIYSTLDKNKENEQDMPLYFRFLTVMAFHVFIDKKVEVAIVEVGIGGEFDCTNVLRKVPVVGITSLGIDHTSLLGSTIESIAWNKAGIMKQNSKTFTVPQCTEAMQVLKERSIEKKCDLSVIDPLHFKLPVKVNVPHSVLNLNASLAVTLCENWLKLRNNNNILLSPEITTSAITQCKWPGRFQIKQDGNLTFYLDGAHTMESIQVCSEWFRTSTASSPKKRALIFNVTGGRDATSLLVELKKCSFDIALFVTNFAGNVYQSDNDDFIPMKSVLDKCELNKEIWLQIHQINDNDSPTTTAKVFPTVLEAISFLRNNDEFNVLATGSLHLIGAVLTIIYPDVNEET